MKNLLLLIALFSISTISFGQTPCDGGRYSSEVFSTVDVTSDITYGSNINFLGSNTTLNLDFYEPNGDTELKRPLIIWAHGGSFIGGSKTDSDVLTLSQEFTKRGFVCASIDYRVGMWPIDSTNAIKALLRASQDMKAAVRYFYADAAGADVYGIDTTQIFIGGSSAGAITAMHYAYLDKECEAEEYLSAATLNSLGGLEGTSGNPGYSTDVVGVINLCGALARYGYIETGDIPFCSLHGNNDGTVPYNRGVANVSGFDVLYLDGTRVLDDQANAVGVEHNFYTYTNANHVPYAGNAAYMDTTVNFVRDFLVQTMGCTVPDLLPENSPLESVDLYQLYFCGLNVSENEELLDLNIFPNPAIEQFEINWNGTELVQTINLSDIQGKIIESKNVQFKNSTTFIQDLEPGVYIITLLNGNTTLDTKRIIIQ